MDRSLLQAVLKISCGFRAVPGKIASRCRLPGFPRTVMAARNVDDLLASFLSCSRLRTPERDGCFISRTFTRHTPRKSPGSVICNWQRGDILIGRLHDLCPPFRDVTVSAI